MCSRKFIRYFCCIICFFTNALFEPNIRARLEECFEKWQVSGSVWLSSKIEQSVAEIVLLLCLPAHLVVRKNNDGDFEISYIDKVCFDNFITHDTTELPKIIFKKDGNEVLLSEENKKYHDILVKIAFCLRSPIWKHNLCKLIGWYAKKRSKNIWNDNSLEGRIANKIDDLILMKVYNWMVRKPSKISNILNKIVHLKDGLLEEDKMSNDQRDRRRKSFHGVLLLILNNLQFPSVFVATNISAPAPQESITLPEEPLLKLFCQLIGEEIVAKHLKPAVKEIIHEDLKPIVTELMDDFKRSDTGIGLNNLKNILLNFQARASIVYSFTNWFYVGCGGTINLRKHASVYLCMGGIISKEFLLFLKKIFVEMILIEAICIDHSIMNFECWQEAYSLNVFILFSFFKYRYFGLVLGGGVQKMNSGFKIGVFYMGGYKDSSIKI